jgi:MFS family permease
MTILVIGTMRNTDVVYGLWTGGQLAFGAAGLIIFPQVIQAFGLAGVFVIIATLSGVLLFTRPFYAQIPAGAEKNQEPGRASPALWVGLTCLAGIFVYYAGQTAVWVYLELIGVTWQLESDLIAKILFAGLVAGIVGATTAVVIGDRIGRRIPVVISLTVSAISISLLLFPGEGSRFAIAVCLFNFAWYLFLPYAAAVIASVDRGGKLLTGLGVVFPASLAAGPAFAAFFVSGSQMIGPVVIGLLSIPVGLLAMLPATRRISSDTATGS